MTTPERNQMADLPWPEPVEPREEVSRAICQACTKDLAPRRGWSARTRLLLSLVVTAVAILALSGGIHPHHGSGSALASTLLGAIGWGLVQVAVLVVGLAVPPGMRTSHRLRWLIAGLVPVAFLGYLALVSSSQLPLHDFMHDHVGGAIACGAHSLLSGGLASAGIFLLWRGTDPFTPGLTGALAGLVGGVAGAVAIGLACPSGEAWHLWIGHGLVVAILVALGWLVGRRWFSP
jgi:hypothetical protein